MADDDKVLIRWHLSALSDEQGSVSEYISIQADQGPIRIIGLEPGNDFTAKITWAVLTLMTSFVTKTRLLWYFKIYLLHFNLFITKQIYFVA